MTTLPFVGAAMPYSRLPEFRDWLLEGPRDLEIQDPAWPNILDTNWQSVIPHIRSMLDGHTGRLGVHGPFWGMPIDAVDHKVQAAVKERLKQSLDYCAELGATHMVVHSPFEFLGTPFAPLQASDGFNLLEIIHSTLEDAVRQATEIGCTLVIENIFDKDPAIWMGLIESFKTPHVRASVDVGHAFINHKLGAPPPDYWIRHAGNSLEHIHLQDSDGFADRHWCLGDGDINFTAIFSAVGKLEKQPRLILELMDPGKIPQAVAWLKQRNLAQ
jgi:sugar phosphate isomerase/epimerase